MDDQLVSILHRATTDPGALESFHGFINLFQDHLAPELLDRLKTPVRVIWGEADPWEPVQQAREWMQCESVQDLQTIEALGHCPHDESPEQINPILLKMLSTQTNKSAES